MDESQDNVDISTKKIRLWSATDFRNKIKTKHKIEAILEFFELCKTANKEEHITEYLERGGNCLELFQLLETDAPPVILLELINNILLKLIADNKLHVVTYDSCRYFLQTYLSPINKMIGLSSPLQERKILLKLLTSIVAISKKLAKEILSHVNFNAANVEVLTKPAYEKDNVRNAYIHFIMSFFVEGDYGLIFMLLDKKYMLLNIFRGLQYDLAETVVLVMDTLYTYLIITTAVNKTTKMGIFGTNTIKEIVNLYNWKGPNKNIQDDKIYLNEKKVVSASVHNLLLALCTSYKYGVIFRDPLLGLGKKSYNILMCTVLDSLERPWEHSYASELVTKICGSCPDLTKTMWNNLKIFLEPRPTEKWLKAMKYAITLVQELQPSNIKFCVDLLNVNQFIQVIPTLAAPQVILNTIIPNDHHFEQSLIKFHCVLLLIEFAKSVKSYYSFVKKHLNLQDGQTLKNSLNEYFYRNFLTARDLLCDWKTKDETYSPTEYLKIVFDLLDLYKIVCPQLLDNFTNISLEGLLRDIESLPSDTTLVKIRAIKLFLNFEPSILNIRSDMFKYSFFLALENYCKEKVVTACDLLYLILRNVGIFDDFPEEIDVWINSFLNVSQVHDVGSIFVEILKHTCDNLLTFISIIQEATDNFKVDEQCTSQISLTNVLHPPLNFDHNLEIKRNRVSPLLIGTFDYLENVEQNKNLKMFVNAVLINLLHVQTNPALLHKLVIQKQHLISKSVCEYLTGWVNRESTILTKTKLCLIENFSFCFLSDDVNNFFEESAESLPIQYFNQALFYFSQLKENLLNDAHLENCLKVCTRVPKDVISVVFKHPTFIRRFSPTSNSVTNSFLAEIMNYSSNNTKEYLKPYRSKLTTSVEVVLKGGNWLHVMQNLEIFGLDSYQCAHLLKIFSKVEIDTENQDLLLLYNNLVVFLLKVYLAQVDFSCVPDNLIIGSIAQLITILNSHQIDSGVGTVLLQKMLVIFPHTLSFVSSELFESILDKNNFCEHSAIFAAFLLKHRNDFTPVLLNRINKVVKIKGLVLPLLESGISINIQNETFQQVYEQLEPSILKGLKKTTKAGPHFERYKEVIVSLIRQFMWRERCLSFVEKVQKIDNPGVFHIQAVITIFVKALCEPVPDNYVHNTIITLAYATNRLFKKRDKSEDEWSKLKAISQLSISYYEILLTSKQLCYRTVCENEVFNLYCNYCLKYGLSRNSEFLRTLGTLTKFLNFSEQEAQKLLEMTGAHSEFLEIALGHESELKKELFDLIFVLCERWPVLLQRNHLPILFAAYRGTMGAADRTIIVLLQMYEKMAHQTNFYDFKPFLWGKAAAAHYSVRQDIQRALWRQPRMIDILEILEQTKVNDTICNHPLNLTLTNSKSEAILANENVYNLAFFLPLFGSLLVTENQVALHTFVKSGALSLTIIGFSCNNKRIRLASAHVLNRLHHHFELKRSGKEKIVRLCFIESLCRGLAATENLKLNNFCSIFWARMSLILLQPLHPMYIPLSRYLSAKPIPELNGIPELYTFLHIPDVNFKEPKRFILKVLYDGMRTNDDCSLVMFKMGFKLLMDVFSSCLSDLETKIFILKIVEKACSLEVGKEIFAAKYGVQSWLYDVVSFWGREEGIIEWVISIIARLTEDISKIANVNIISLIVITIIDDGHCCVLSKNRTNFKVFLKILRDVFETSNDEFLTLDRLQVLIDANENDYCAYLLKFGGQFSIFPKEDDLLQQLIKKWLDKS